MLTIWGRTTSSNVQKVLWCCAELGIEFERIDWGGSFGGNDAPAYRAMNPNGRVPTVKDGDTIIWESNTIIRYLCATRGGAHLHPVDPARRSKVERWMDWQIATLNPPMTSLLFGYYRQPESERNLKALGDARARTIDNWSIVERELRKHDYLAGDDFTLADIGTGILVHRWFNFPIERPHLPRLALWYQMLSRRPGFLRHGAGPVS